MTEQEKDALRVYFQVTSREIDAAHRTVEALANMLEVLASTLLPKDSFERTSIELRLSSLEYLRKLPLSPPNASGCGPYRWFYDVDIFWPDRHIRRWNSIKELFEK